MILKRIEVGPLLTNCYIIGCKETKIGAIVDPGDESERLVGEAQRLGLKVEQIINTHGHGDHIAGNEEVKKLTRAKIFIHPEDAIMLTDPYENLSLYYGPVIVSPPADAFLEEGKVHHIGNLEFKILHIPGHSRGSVCLVSDNQALVGDTLFAGSIGRTDFPHGSYELLVTGIRRKLFTLPPKTEVYPGHGESTTIEIERRENPFFA
jgi:glyoxylase-like metal-dependent hydrolase (beta-lactamase superfamily II)